MKKTIAVTGNRINLHKNYTLRESFLKNIKIVSQDAEGNLKTVYAGPSKVIIFDKNEEIATASVTSTTDDSDIEIDHTQNGNNSGVSIIPLEEITTNNVTIEEYNSDTTPNVFECNNTTNFVDPYKGGFDNSSTYQNVTVSENPIRVNTYNEKEIECGIFLAQLRARKEQVAKETRKIIYARMLNQTSVTPTNVASKQNISTFMGDASKILYTATGSAFYAADLQCNDNLGSEIVIDGSQSKSHSEIYQSNEDMCLSGLSLYHRVIIRNSGNNKSIFLGKYFMKPKPKLIFNEDNMLNGYYVCPGCNKLLKRREHMEKHIGRHGDPNFECLLCDIVYATKKALIRHLCTHNRVFVCAQCQK
ncbi:hypothetical protein K1T71_000075 [Dendrolimus kikuchii]|uniref:Uncharacterized protein n=1 Tax=Dendrolimus kikuchii TaxID=765133 RepID=A0ACC1DJR1_9NEOP|nr:hypothetical protein K1T71_000075 [Dendrolimus kikuchii]